MIPAGGRRSLFAARVSTPLFSPAELLRARSQPPRMFQSQEYLVSSKALRCQGWWGWGEIYDRPQTHYGTKGAVVNYGSKYPRDQTCAAAAAASVDTLQSTVMTRRKRWLILRDRGIWPSAPWRIYAGAGGQRRRDQICMMVQKKKMKTTQ